MNKKMTALLIVPILLIASGSILFSSFTGSILTTVNSTAAGDPAWNQYVSSTYTFSDNTKIANQTSITEPTSTVDQGSIDISIFNLAPGNWVEFNITVTNTGSSNIMLSNYSLTTSEQNFEGIQGILTNDSIALNAFKFGYALLGTGYLYNVSGLPSNVLFPGESAVYTIFLGLGYASNNSYEESNFKIVLTVTVETVSTEIKGPDGALTIGYWKNQGLKLIESSSSSNGISNLGQWLRQFNPFKDLSSTSNVSQVATYVRNTIENASGADMNTMLKAQMLATALNVYFSSSSLGGNYINAPNPIGAAIVDLYNIPSVGNVSADFNNLQYASIYEMLNISSSYSNPGGTTWYGNIKSIQDLAMETFNAINNQDVYILD